MIPVRTIDPRFDVAPQLTPAEIPGVAAMGYTTLICMRPDHEGHQQPAYAEMEAAARSAGLDSVYFPVVPGSMTVEQARSLKEILAGREGKVLAYCASGNRCAMAYDMAQRL